MAIHKISSTILLGQGKEANSLDHETRTLKFAPHFKFLLRSSQRLLPLKKDDKRAFVLRTSCTRKREEGESHCKRERVSRLLNESNEGQPKNLQRDSTRMA